MLTRTLAEKVEGMILVARSFALHLGGGSWGVGGARNTGVGSGATFGAKGSLESLQLALGEAAFVLPLPAQGALDAEARG